MTEDAIEFSSGTLCGRRRLLAGRPACAWGIVELLIYLFIYLFTYRPALNSHNIRLDSKWDTAYSSTLKRYHSTFRWAAGTKYEGVQRGCSDSTLVVPPLYHPWADPTLSYLYPPPQSTLLRLPFCISQTHELTLLGF